MKTSKTFHKGNLALLVFILLIACEKEPQIEISQEEQPRIEVDYLPIEQLPQLEQALTSVMTDNAPKFISGKTLKYKKARIDAGNILKVKGQNNSVNYTMHVFVEGAPENEFYNLVTRKTPSGKLKKPYVLRYVVDEDAMDGFVASNYSFSHFNGVRYIYSFDKFFSDYDIAQKTVADPCDNGSVITNAGQSGYGGIRDIPVTNNLQTDVELYDFSQSNASDSFTLFFNSYDDVSNADTSYGDTVQTELIQVTSNDNPNTVIQLPPLGTNSSGAITLVGTTVSKARTTKNTEGTLTGCTITITREYSDATVVTIDYNCLQAPLKPIYSKKSTSGDCPENEGETGVLTTSAMVAEIVEAYGLSTLTKERLMYLNSSPYTSDIYNYLKNNNFSSQAMEYSLFAIDSLIDGTFNNYREITEKEQNYRADMSKSELAMFDSMPKADQFKYLKSALVAINKSAELFPLNERTNGKGDAFRHAYWNALATQSLGVQTTKLLTTKHEEKPSRYPYNWKEVEMDLFNNQVGRDIASNGSTDLVEDILNTVMNGELRYINNLANNYQATYSSKIIPTNQ